MPGLEMPARGAGAAMLRELRDEERPPLSDERSPLSEKGPPEGDKPSLLQGRGLEEKSGGTDPSLSHLSNPQTDQSYDNMTNKLTDNKTEQKENIKTGKQPKKQTIKPDSQTETKLDSQLEGQVAGQSVSVAEMIRRRAAQRGEQEVLKTVTLKLSPTLDEKIEQYCFNNRMKKQEFWAEAAALYFETVGLGVDQGVAGQGEGY